MTNAAPGQARTHTIAAVPVHRPGTHLSEDALRTPLVARIDAGGKAVLRVVHQLDRCGIVGNFLDADDRPEAFFAHHVHAVVDVDQHGRFEPVARTLDAVAAHQ